MMIHSLRNPTVEIPKWDPPNDEPPTSPLIFSPQTNTYVTALQRYLPSSTELTDPDFDSFSCDEFRMYEFKVRKCTRGRSHDWTDCPFAHPGEKARRRDPRKYHYSGTACPDFRRGGCPRGDTCQYAHGVFECWLHPARYRTHPCKDGPHCKRRVCFFAHSPDQLRVLVHDPDDELVGPMMGLHVGESTWRVGLGLGLGLSDTWKPGFGEEEEQVMERVESGKGLRARIYGKVGMENSLGCDRVESASYGADFGWVSEIVN